MADGNNVLNYPQMARQREENIQANEIAYAEDVNAEFDYIMDTFNQLVAMLTGEWGDGTGRIYDLVDDAVSLANQALVAAQNCVQKTGDTMTGHLNISLVPASDYNVVNKKYVDDTIDAELAEPINRITTLENWKTNLDATQIKLDNANFSSTNINDGMNELFISVSNGKAIVAAAITGKGIETASDASFKTMADNINAILTFTEGTSGGTATAQDIMYGKTAYARGGLIVGNYIPLDTSDATATAADIAYGKTAYARDQLLVGTLVGFDTSDATATPYDILQGKSAYVGTGKIDGILKINEDTGEPSYDIGAVEKVYSSNPDTVKIQSLDALAPRMTAFTYYNDPAGKYYYWYKITFSMTSTTSIISTSSTLKITNETTNETKTFGLINDLKIKGLTSDTDEQGSTENLRLYDVAITKEGEYSYLALIIFAQRSNTSIADYTLILIPFTSNGNHIDQFIFDTENIKYYYLNSLSKYKNSIITNYNTNKTLTISENKTRMAINLLREGNYSVILFLNIDPITLAMNKINEISSYSGNDITDMIIFPSSNPNIAYSKEFLFVFKENNNISSFKLVSKESNAKSSNFAISEDGTHYVEIFYLQSGSNYSNYISYGALNINYENGSVTQTKIARIAFPILTSEIERVEIINNPFFMGNSKILITNYTNTDSQTVCIAYKVNFENENVFEPIVDTEDRAYTQNMSSYAGTNCAIIDSVKFIIAPDYTNVIGLKFNNEYYYKQEKGILSATPSDVTTGKTFIGYNGEIETGTMEV